jgi:hypothetical protein
MADCANFFKSKKDTTLPLPFFNIHSMYALQELARATKNLIGFLALLPRSFIEGDNGTNLNYGG